MSRAEVSDSLRPMSPGPGSPPTATGVVRSTRVPVVESVEIYDTPLLERSQQEGLSLTVDDKLPVAGQLDELGVAYIEGGWPALSDSIVYGLLHAENQD